MRFKLPPGGDVPAEVAARRLGMETATFKAALEILIGRGFPPADQTTGNFDLDAIDTWRRARHPHLFPADRLTPGTPALDARSVVRGRLRGGTGG